MNEIRRLRWKGKDGDGDESGKDGKRKRTERRKVKAIKVRYISLTLLDAISDRHDTKVKMCFFV